MTSKQLPEHGTILYQLTQEDLLAFGERIFRNLWEQVSTKTEKLGRYYTRQECCEILRCSLPTFHALVNKGLIPVTKVGRKTLISADDFDGIVASGELRKFKHHPTVKEKGGRNYGR